MGPVTASNSCTAFATSWGWMKTEDGLYEPNWTTLPEASKACYELHVVSCKCKMGCVRRCKCKKAALECTVP